MPSKSLAQHRLMEAAAHSPGGYGGVPQSVGKEFAAADKAKKTGPAAAHMARRQKQGLTHKQVAEEFGASRSTVGRRLKGHGDSLRHGFNRMGSAS